MHELLLFGQIPSSRHHQVLNILAGIAAMQPQPVLGKHLVFKPNRSRASGRPTQVGGAQDIQKAQIQALQAQSGGDLFYVQLVKEEAAKLSEKVAMNVSKESSGENEEDNKVSTEQHSTSDPVDPTNPNGSKASRGWTLQFRDLPEAARQRQVTSRLIADLPIVSGDPMSFMTALDYLHTTTYFLSGDRFTHLSTSILLYRLYIPPNSANSNVEDDSTDVSHMRLLDPTGTYMLQFAIRVLDGSSVETMSTGTRELLNLKETLKGVVELEMGDRLALDTRVK